LAPPSSVRARWAPRLALIGYVGLLATSVLAPGGRAGVGGAGFFDLRTGSRVRAVAVALAVYVVLETVRFLPVGVLAVLSLPRTRRDRLRMLLLGHRRLEDFVGPVLDERDWRRAAPLARTPLRGREDWTKHFFVSAALTVLSAQAPSDAIGVF
jgi:hypothetical protein